MSKVFLINFLFWPAVVLRRLLGRSLVPGFVADDVPSVVAAVFASDSAFLLSSGVFKLRSVRNRPNATN